MSNHIKCKFCGKLFTPVHGNELYCCDEHKRFQKAIVQKKFYRIIKEFRNGFLANYKLFEELLPKSGSKTYPLSQLNNRGFKPKCYYGKTETERGQVFYW